MIHEGPVLEYGGRDLALLQWSAAARHWVVLVLAAQVFVPHATERVGAARVLPFVLVVLCAALALVETLVAKMRILLAPRLVAVGARGRVPRRPLLAGRDGVTGFLAWLLVASGIAVVVVRRRSVVVGIVTVQALVLAVAALVEAETTDDAVAAGALALRGVILAVLFAGVVARTRERVPVHARVPPLLRGGLAVLLALALVWLVPPIGLETREAERAVLTLIAFGVATAGLRRATILQVLGIVLVENGLALAALELPGAEAAAGIEIGVAIDLTLISIVAIVFHQRIFGLFGAGDTAALRTLRD